MITLPKIILLLVVCTTCFSGCKSKKLIAITEPYSVSISKASPSSGSQSSVWSLQQKYAKFLAVKPVEITHIKLFEFIDQWIKTPYLMGGETNKGIDCSSFTQLLYGKVYDRYIERTAQKQFDSESIDKFRGAEYLREGDLIFFVSSPKDKQHITHVGIYLGNSRFVHATAHRGKSGYRGVKISNLNDTHWQSRFIAAGHKLTLKY